MNGACGPHTLPFHFSVKVSLSSSSSSSCLSYSLFTFLLLFQEMETSKAEGKRRMKDKLKEEMMMEEEEEEEDEYIVGLGFGEDDKKKKTLTSSGRKGSSGGGSMQPCCQVENCAADMTDSKKYHRRHKVCEFHAKAPLVVVAGLRQRFCQQCSRFHELSEFDEAKRSCRRRLAGHNERRRKISYESLGDGSSGKGYNPQSKTNKLLAD